MLSFLSAVSEKLTSDLFKVQGGVSITDFALIFLTLMPAAASAGGDSNSECLNSIWFLFKKTEEVWSKYSVVSWI